MAGLRSGCEAPPRGWVSAVAAVVSNFVIYGKSVG